MVLAQFTVVNATLMTIIQVPASSPKAFKSRTLLLGLIYDYWKHKLGVPFDSHWVLTLGLALRVRSMIRCELLSFYDSNTELKSEVTGPDFGLKVGQIKCTSSVGMQVTNLLHMESLQDIILVSALDSNKTPDGLRFTAKWEFTSKICTTAYRRPLFVWKETQFCILSLSYFRAERRRWP